MVSPFTPNEIRFLAKYEFSEEDVYDGRFQTKFGREASAKQADKHIVLARVVGRGSCGRLGHRLRTRAGHCIQCKPTNIAYQTREDKPGYVYIAGSLSRRVIKIGTAGDLSQREKQMRAEGYGGSSDWEILFSVWVSKGGEFEREVSSRVQARPVYRMYFKDGMEQAATEMFRCSFSEAFRAMNECLNVENAISPALSLRTRRYEFGRE